MKPRPAVQRRLNAVCYAAVLALALLASGCARLSAALRPPPTSTPRPQIPTLARNPEVANDPDLNRFMAALAERGIAPLSVDTSQNPLLRPAPGLAYGLDQGHLHVHVYPTAADAQHLAPQVHTALSESIADWIGTPHLFECGRLLAMYFGDDTDELKAMNEACLALQATPPPPAGTNN